MADPQINNAVRAQCIWRAASGLPEDRFVTSWAFIRGGAMPGSNAESQAEEVAERLREFWLTPVEPGPQPVAGFLPSAVTSQGLEIRCYDLGQEVPREPRIFEYTFASGSGGSQLPREVAVCLSFFAGRNLPRRRGRVFIGPLTSTAVTESAAGPVVKSDFRQVLSAAAQRLALEEGINDEMDWAVLSQRDGEIRPVTAGWVDDAFDTVRKRGSAALSRTTWPA